MADPTDNLFARNGVAHLVYVVDGDEGENVYVANGIAHLVSITNGIDTLPESALLDNGVASLLFLMNEDDPQYNHFITTNQAAIGYMVNDLDVLPDDVLLLTNGVARPVFVLNPEALG